MMDKRIRTLLARLTVALVFALTASMAQASPILQGSPTAATGITGLDVSGTEYDVSFSVAGTYNDEFGSSTPAFFGNETGAEAARDAIRDVLIANTVTGIGGLPTDLVHSLRVPWDLTTNEVATKWIAQSTTGESDWFSGATDNYPRSRLATNASWARFTPAQVPEPVTLALMGLGLAAIGYQRRKQIKAA